MTVSIRGIDQAIAGLNYRNTTALKYRLLSAIRSHYDNIESQEALPAIDTDRLIQELWNIEPDSSEIQSKRKNLNSIKSTINADLDRAWHENRNPEGITIGPLNTFMMSNEAKDKVLSSLSGAATGEGGVPSLEQIGTALKLISDYLSSRKGPDTTEEMAKLRSVIDKIAKDVGDGDISNYDLVEKGTGPSQSAGVSEPAGKSGGPDVSDRGIIPDAIAGKGSVSGDPMPTGREVGGSSASDMIDNESSIDEIVELDEVIEDVPLETDEAVEVVGEEMASDFVDSEELLELEEPIGEEILELEETIDEDLEGLESVDELEELIEDEVLDSAETIDDEIIEENETAEIIESDDLDLVEATNTLLSEGSESVEGSSGGMLTGEQNDGTGTGVEDSDIIEEVEELVEEADELVELEEIIEEEEMAPETVEVEEMDMLDYAENLVQPFSPEIDPAEEGRGEPMPVGGGNTGEGFGDSGSGLIEIGAEGFDDAIDEDEIQELEELIEDDLVELDEEIQGPDEEFEAAISDEIMGLDEPITDEEIESETALTEEELLDIDESIPEEAVDVEEVAEDEVLELEEDVSNSNLAGNLDDWMRQVGLSVDIFNENEIDPEHLNINAEKKKMLAARFDGYLGTMERYYNQIIFIPSGRYLVGGKGGAADERTMEHIELPEFYMGKFPVTNAIFEIFVDRTGYVTTAEKLGHGYVYFGRFKKIVDPKSGKVSSVWNASVSRKKVEGATWYQPLGPGSSLHNKRNHPVVQVSQKDAVSFAAWIGKRLPKEVEWEAAARTLDGRPFPWGDEWQEEACNIESSGISDTTAVDGYPKGENPLALSDLLGNVMEWTSDPIEPKYSVERKSVFYVAKGGGWIATKDYRLSFRARLPSDFSSNLLGFRCVTD